MARQKKQTKLPTNVKAVYKIPRIIGGYQVRLDMAGIVYDSTGETLHEALANLPLTYMDVKTKGVITVISGDKKCERLFYLRPLKALIANKLRKVGYAKQMEALLK